ncbi:MAG: arginine--tRNA ligase [Marine Group II euryarchaeote MED-G33]|nr:MAG: arginine--tRNA ligase [Marine Group II euryarchaeote MED-G33]|tara:strand:+ start:1199 stop:2917 length:1719 start_codon:yes stop_codon:yes gene_type:complete
MQVLIDEVLPSLELAMADVGVKGDFWKKMLSRSKEASQGDLALPCFPFAKQLGCSPDEAATQIANALQIDVGEAVAVGPYVNIRASMDWLTVQLSKEPETKESILIEHTSANPNGPFHVGRARNAVLGDTFVRMYRAAGYDVTAEYYVDDMGKQVGILCWALENLEEEQVQQLLIDGEIPIEKSPHSSKDDHARVLWYQAANLLKSKDPVVDSGVTELVQKSEEADEDILNRFEAAYQPVLDGMLETLGRMGIAFDSFTKESKFIVDGSVEILMDQLQSSQLHGVAENGAHYLELESKGVKGKSTQFFYRRGDGSSLYATRDLAYHQYKWTRSGRLLNILGEDHKLQSKQVGIALDELNTQNPEVVFYAFTKLADGKMSTRRGNVVYMDDLLDEARSRALETVRDARPDLPEEKLLEIAEAVGVSATRFNIARISPEKGITFRWSDALSLEADSAPFIMYSHARSCSIRRKAGEVDLSVGLNVAGLSGSAADLVRRMAYMNDELQTAIDSNAPHNFCAWLSSLAVDYNRFYRDNYVIEDGVVNVQNLILSELAREHLRRGCEAVGIIPIEEM